MKKQKKKTRKKKRQSLKEMSMQRKVLSKLLKIFQSK